MAKAKKRPRHAMPAATKSALSKRGVLKAYNERPAYQRNDYLGWIAQGKTDATQTKRREQMLSELARGGVYMGMKHTASAKAAKKKAPKKKTAPRRAR